jgi:hypothetical protein
MFRTPFLKLNENKISYVNASPASYAGTYVDWVQRHADSDRDSLRRLYLQYEYASSTNDTKKSLDE